MDQETLEQLYDEHAEGLFQYLCSLLQGPDEARDHLQDLFVKIAQRPSEIRELEHERAYLFRMAHNLAIDTLRRQGVYQGKLKTIRQETKHLFAASEDPDRQTFRDQLASGFDTLPIDQREVVYLKLFEEMTFDELATVLEISPNTAASRYRYGLDKLRTHLRPLYNEIHENVRRTAP